MNVLVLSGGGIKGAFQAGALEVILQEFEPHVIYGTSVGALNGVFLAERRGRDKGWPAIGGELVDFWRNNITRTADIAGKRNIFKLLCGLLFKKFDSLYSAEPVRRLLEREINLDALRASPVGFAACAVDIHSGEHRFIAKYHPDILDFVMASAAIPAVYPPVCFEGRYYTDGGILDVAPVSRLNPGDKIVVVGCYPERTGEIEYNRRDLGQFMDVITAIMTGELMKGDLAGSKTSARVIRPAAHLNYELLNFNSADVLEMVELGRRAAREA